MQGYLLESAIIAGKDAQFLGEVQGAKAVLDALASDLDPSWGLDAVPDLIQDATVSILRAAGGLEGAGADLLEALSELAWAWKISREAARDHAFLSGWAMIRTLDPPGDCGCMGPAT